MENTRNVIQSKQVLLAVQCAMGRLHKAVSIYKDTSRHLHQVAASVLLWLWLLLMYDPQPIYCYEESIYDALIGNILAMIMLKKLTSDPLVF